MPKEDRKGQIARREIKEEVAPYPIQNGADDNKLPEKVRQALLPYCGYENLRKRLLAGLRDALDGANESAAKQLDEDGVVVLRFLDETSMEVVRDVMEAEIACYPEYREGATRLVSGSFGGYGNPTSFHSPMTRILREMAMVVAKKLFTGYCSLKGYELAHCFLQQLFDRIVRRTRGDKIPSEQWHRDTVSPTVRVPLRVCPPYASKENEIREPKETASHAGQLFGGWVNLNGNNQCQYFSCALGTHSDAPHGTGFDKVSKEEVAAIPRGRFVQKRIKPGRLLLFRQNIIHEVRAYTVGPHELRQHFAFNLSTNGRRTMFGREYLTDTINIQRTPMLPSGQLPPMYSQNDLSFRTDALSKWSQETLRDIYLHWTEFGKTSKRAGECYKKCYRFIMYFSRVFWPAYQNHERRTMEPQPLASQ